MERFMIQFFRKLVKDGAATMENRNLKRRKNCKGQILTEYVTMTVMAFSIVLVLFLLLAVFAEYNWRMTALLGWEP